MADFLRPERSSNLQGAPRNAGIETACSSEFRNQSKYYNRLEYWRSFRLILDASALGLSLHAALPSVPGRSHPDCTFHGSDLVRLSFLWLQSDDNRGINCSGLMHHSERVSPNDGASDRGPGDHRVPEESILRKRRAATPVLRRVPWNFWPWQRCGHWTSAGARSGTALLPLPQRTSDGSCGDCICQDKFPACGRLFARLPSDPAQPIWSRAQPRPPSTACRFCCCREIFLRVAMLLPCCNSWNPRPHRIFL